MKYFTLYPVLLIATTGLLFACGGSASRSSSGTVAEQYQGVWLAPAYGMGLSITEREAAFIDYTYDSCLLSDSGTIDNDAQITEQYRLDSERLVFFADTGTADFYAPAITFERAEALPEVCQQGYTPQLGDADYRPEPEQDLAMLYQLINTYSISIERSNIDWDAEYQQAQTLVNPQSTAAEVFDAMAPMVLSLQDIHTSISSPVGVARGQNKPLFAQLLLSEFMVDNNLSAPLDQANSERANQYIATQLLAYRDVAFEYAGDTGEINTDANGLLTWFVNDGLGYLRIDAMTGFSDDDTHSASLNALERALDRVLRDIRDTQGLVIDVRTNSGGNDFLSLAIASRFVDQKTHVYSKQAGQIGQRTELVDVYLQPRGESQYVKPIVLLTSASTVSAAEVFSLAMRSLNHVTLMGESTQGAFSDELEKKLPNGFEISFSNEIYLSPEGEWFEGSGVPVDISVAMFTQQERQQETDIAINTAIEYLLAR